MTDDYGRLFGWHLDGWFGEPVVVSSMYPRALLTAFLVTQADQIVQDARLTEEGLSNLQSIVREGVQGERLTVCFGHEPRFSLLAQFYGMPKDEPKLGECQAFVFFIDDDKNVISVQKFAPDATL